MILLELHTKLWLDYHYAFSKATDYLKLCQDPDYSSVCEEEENKEGRKKSTRKKKNENSIIITPNYRMFLTHPFRSAIFLTQSSHSSLTHTVISLTHSPFAIYVCLSFCPSLSLTFHFTSRYSLFLSLSLYLSTSSLPMFSPSLPIPFIQPLLLHPLALPSLTHKGRQTTVDLYGFLCVCVRKRVRVRVGEKWYTLWKEYHLTFFSPLPPHPSCSFSFHPFSPLLFLFVPLLWWQMYSQILKYGLTSRNKCYPMFIFVDFFFFYNFKYNKLSHMTYVWYVKEFILQSSRNDENYTYIYSPSQDKR